MAQYFLRLLIIFVYLSRPLFLLSHKSILPLRTLCRSSLLHLILYCSAFYYLFVTCIYNELILIPFFLCFVFNYLLRSSSCFLIFFVFCSFCKILILTLKYSLVFSSLISKFSLYFIPLFLYEYQIFSLFLGNVSPRL